MIIGPELGRWLAGREAQKRSRDDAQAFALAWNDGPVHSRLQTAMAALPTRSADAVAGCLRELFEDSAWTGQLVEALALALRRDPCFAVPFRHLNSDINSGLLVYEDELVSIALASVGLIALAARKKQAAGRRSIMFSGQVELLKFVKSGNARLSWWTAPAIESSFSAATAGRCAPADERQVRDGDILVVDGRRESFVIEQACANLVLLQATVKPDQAPVSVEYDHATREYVGCSAVGDSDSRIQMISSLLRLLGAGEAVPAILPFLDHPSFFVRWHVMRELFVLDVEAALPHLKRMAARDPHSETRRAARTVLDRIEAPKPAREAA